MTTDGTALLGSIDQILKFNIEEHLLKTERFGKEFSFLQIKVDLEQLYGAVNRVKAQDLTTIPLAFIQSLNASLHQLLPAITRIVQYTPQGTNDGRNSIIAEFLEKDRSVMKDSMMILMYPLVFGGIESQSNDAGRKAYAEFLDTSKFEATTHLDRIKKESQEQFDSVKESLAVLTDKARELGVTKYAEVFESQSSKYSTSSAWWLVAVILFLGSILGGVAFVLANPIVKAVGTDDTSFIINVIQIALARILVASTLFFGLAASLKNFRAYRHNEILNKHRQNALETFEAFSNSAADPQTKSAVLVEATHSIFGHQITGFSTTDKDSEVPSKIIEVLKPQISNQ